MRVKQLVVWSLRTQRAQRLLQTRRRCGTPRTRGLRRLLDVCAGTAVDGRIYVKQRVVPCGCCCVRALVLE